MNYYQYHSTRLEITTPGIVWIQAANLLTVRFWPIKDFRMSKFTIDMQINLLKLALYKANDL